MQLSPIHLSVGKLMQGRLFRIPDYQRHSWQAKQRQDLFADIRDVHRSGREHFMATVVGLARDRHQIGGDEFGVVELVEGQQRVTTLVILLKAIEKGLDGGDKAQARIKGELADLLVKGDEHNLVLLQTNHDSSDVFSSYVRSGEIRRGSVVTAADANLVAAAEECEGYVAEWKASGPLVDLVFVIRNRLSMIYHELADESAADVSRQFQRMLSGCRADSGGRTGWQAQGAGPLVNSDLENAPCVGEWTRGLGLDLACSKWLCCRDVRSGIGLAVNEARNRWLSRSRLRPGT